MVLSLQEHNRGERRLAESLESQSVYWNDDLYYNGSFVLKTIKQFAHSEGKPISLLSQVQGHRG
ncbi:hypothetical protein [Muribaculum gordoncarteri]|uniref:hypothetical protein n=1 Tax=Muribaculum gordoncarteri TaxID=2530390 RepID=UPI003F66D3E0